MVMTTYLQLQETLLQNERSLERTRRKSHVQRDQALETDAVGDFLQYIDVFHMETLALTQRQLEW